MPRTYAQKLHELANFLELYRDFWNERPFTKLPVLWEAKHPNISKALRSISLDTIEEYESRPWELIDMPPTYHILAKQCQEWSFLPDFFHDPKINLSKRPRKVPERKWQQISLFANVVLSCQKNKITSWLDWCSGKGHLGQAIAKATSMDLCCIEKDETLCKEGQHLANKAGLTVQFITRDVMMTNNFERMGKGVALVSLHACGKLHQKLFDQALQGQTGFLACAPCCYHRIDEDSYRPMSLVARRTGLELMSHHLRLVGLSEAVAGTGRRELRRREQAFRLGFDCLIREIRGRKDYFPPGPSPRSWAHLSFQEFCNRIAQRSKIALPKEWDSEKYEGIGWNRLKTVRALGMIRGLFRGPLEMWLLLDRAQYLFELGWKVQLGRFCQPSITPRNALLLAWK